MEELRQRQGQEEANRWHVEEWKSDPKPGRAYNEDGFLNDESCIAVLDGVSSGTSQETIESISPGQFAVHIGIEALKEAAHLGSIHDVVPFVSERLREALRPYHVSSMPSFVFVAFFPKWNAIIRVGDSSYKLKNSTTGEWEGNNPGHLVDAHKEVVRQKLLQNKLDQGVTQGEALADPSIKHRMHRITQEWQPQFRNNPDIGERGYGVVTGEMIHHIDIIPVGNTEEIILASDGYYPDALKGSVAETEREQDRLKELNPLTFHPDDCTYVRIKRRK